MIDPTTRWFEIKEIPSKDTAVIANLVELTWLTRYPWPIQITFNTRGTKFMPSLPKMVRNDYGIKTKPLMQANSIIE